MDAVDAVDAVDSSFEASDADLSFPAKDDDDDDDDVNESVMEEEKDGDDDAEQNADVNDRPRRGVAPHGIHQEADVWSNGEKPDQVTIAPLSAATGRGPRRRPAGAISAARAMGAEVW